MSTSAPPVEARDRRHFSVSEYHRMGGAGILAEDERVELVAGELLTMAPIGPRHAACVNQLVQLLSPVVGNEVVVSPQNALVLTEDTEFYPDIALLRGRPGRYADEHPRAEDALLVIEVAESSLRRDREVKAPLYARTGVSELWIVNLAAGCVEVMREPEPNGYATSVSIKGEEVLTPQALPTVRIAVSELLPPASR